MFQIFVGTIKFIVPVITQYSTVRDLSVISLCKTFIKLSIVTSGTSFMTYFRRFLFHFQPFSFYFLLVLWLRKCRDKVIPVEDVMAY